MTDVFTRADVLALVDALRDRGVTAFEGFGVKLTLTPPPPKPLDPDRAIPATAVKPPEDIDKRLFGSLPGFVKREPPKPRQRPPSRKAVNT